MDQLRWAQPRIKRWLSWMIPQMKFATKQWLIWSGRATSGSDLALFFFFSFFLLWLFATPMHPKKKKRIFQMCSKIVPTLKLTVVVVGFPKNSSISSGINWDIEEYLERHFRNESDSIMWIRQCSSIMKPRSSPNGIRSVSSSGKVVNVLFFQPWLEFPPLARPSHWHLQFPLIFSSFFLFLSSHMAMYFPLGHLQRT